MKGIVAIFSHIRELPAGERQQGGLVNLIPEISTETVNQE